MSDPIVVVGGGVVGLACAAAVVEADSAATVTVLEQGRCGEGATGYAGAIDIPFAPAPWHRDVIRAAEAWWRDAAGRTGGEGSFPRAPLPFAWLEPDAAAVGDLGRYLVHPLGEALGTALAGGVWSVPEELVAYSGAAHVISPPGLCRLLCARLEASGRAVVREGIGVVDAVDDAGAVLTLTDGSVLEARRCMVAVGPWATELPGPVGGWLRTLVRIKRVYGLRLRLEPQVSPHFGVGSAAYGIFLFPLESGEEYAMTVRHTEWDVPPIESHVIPAEVRQRAERFLNTVVGPGEWTITRARVFADAYSPNTTPVVRRFPAGDAVVAVTGLHGSGVRLAPGVASLAAAEVLGRRPASSGSL